MISFRKRILAICCLIIIAFSSCDKDSSNSVDPGTPTDEYGSIVVMVMDEHENPIDLASVSLGEVTRDGTRTTILEIAYLRTDSEGIARFDSLSPGTYAISSGQYYYTGTERTSYLLHQLSDITVSGGEIVSKSFYFPVGPVDMAVKVEFSSNVTPKYEDFNLYIPDWDRTVSLDKMGNCVLTDFDIALNSKQFSHQVIASRNGISSNETAFLKTDSDGWHYYFVNISSRPVVEILTPQNEAIFNNSRVRLTCDGYDFEDGDLPDDGLVWHSNIDGDLGSGSETLSPMLSAGRHRITLTGRDSIGSSSKKSVIINVSHFSDQSFFPLPHDGEWKYLHEIPELVVTTDTGETEHWSLDDMTVTSHDITTRTCRMDWTIEHGGETQAYNYRLTDHLAIDKNLFQVTATDELLSIYEGDDLVRELAVGTVYTPFYPLLVDCLDPQTGVQENVAVTAESVLEYTVADLGLHTMENTEIIDVSYEVGSPENITTAAGTYSSIPFRSTYNGVERTWWLARGIGIVRMEYDLSGETVTASLYDTNMADFAGSAGKRAASFRSTGQVRIQVDSSAGEQEKMWAIMNVMRGLCPR